MRDYTASDESLIQATGKGDLKAFEEIVRRHHTWAWRVAHRYLGHEEDAADVVQEAFLRLMAASSRYRPSATFRTYFYRIVTRLCFDHSKKKRPSNLGDLADVPDSRPDAPDVLAEKEKNLAIRTAIETLPPSQRMVIILRYYEELGYQEIASALESRLSRVSGREKRSLSPATSVLKTEPP